MADDIKEKDLGWRERVIQNGVRALEAPKPEAKRCTQCAGQSVRWCEHCNGVGWQPTPP